MQSRAAYGRRLAAVTIGLGVTAAALAALAQSALAQTGAPTATEREVKSSSTPGDKSRVWTLDFRFKDPRIIKVHVPNKGTRIYYYLWYQVINYTGAPRDFIPVFELVTVDYPGNHRDQIEPTVLEEIKKVEDLTGYQEIKSSVDISAQKIAPSKPVDEAFPHAVTGVAIWPVTEADPAKRDPKVKDISDSTRFSIFVTGLTNAYVTVDPIAPGAPPVTRWKTLQINFKRQHEKFTLDSRDIQFVPNAEWVYRAGSPPPEKAGAEKAPPGKDKK
jgi:hypothetical protein